MALFRKRLKTETPKAAVPEPPKEDARVPQQTALTSGRMAAFFRRLYLWVFSVNVTRDVYQIESGTDSFAEEPLPIRGYYHTLLERLAAELLPEQQEAFRKAFSAENIRHAVREGRSSLSSRVCARQLGEASPTVLKWYAVEAEWPLDVAESNIVIMLSVRPLQSDLDTGIQPPPEPTLRRTPSGSIDWELTRARCFQNQATGMTFEYDRHGDCLYLHRRQGDPESDRVMERFRETMNSRADMLISHDSLDEVLKLLENDGDVQEEMVLCRREGVIGAPFHHYRVTVASFEEAGESWLLGHMEDVEEELQQTERRKDISKAVDTLLDSSDIAMYYLNTQQDRISRIVQDGKGFHLDERVSPLTEYIRKRVSSGRIAPEFQQEYLRWLDKDYLMQKTMRGPYEFEARIRDMKDVEFQWYVETILPVQGRSGQYIRWCRNDTAGHKLRQVEFEKQELLRIGNYNRDMLEFLANLIEFRSVESSEHIGRVRRLTEILLQDIRTRSPQYELTRQQIGMVAQAATMHDIGKISVPDYILNKTGKYTPEEFDIMKKHTTAGAVIVDRISMPGWEQLKDCIRDVVLHHHERYDGKGYPEGLKGDEISIGAQAVSLADVYDALVSVRCYKEGYDPEEALRMILRDECGVFNPVLLESLKACEKQMREIYYV